MPKFAVLRPIEHRGTLYIPPTGNAAETAKSASHGQDIPVDASGVIELSEKTAAEMKHKQIRPFTALEAGLADPDKKKKGKRAE